MNTEWPLSEQSEIDAMIDDYKKDILPQSVTADQCKLEPMEVQSPGESDESGNDQQQLENTQPSNPNSNEDGIFFKGMREGLATCEFCSRLGIKHAFYPKSKRFCSLACSRNFSTAAKENKDHHRKGLVDMSSYKAVQKYRTPQTLIQNKSDSNCFDWSEYLNDTQATAAPVACFKHAPMAHGWENISPGLKVEVFNTDCNLGTQVYWIATVIKLAGYRALMRYEGFGTDNRCDFWINLCIQDVHPVGFCATTRKPLVPPQSISEKYVDWKDFLVKRLTDARTIPRDFYNKVHESLTKHPLKPHMMVEVVDRTCVSAMRVATVEEVIGGRLRLQYEDSKNGPGDEFWCHRESSLVHPMGWSCLVGHKLHSSADYKTKSLNKIAFESQGPQDSTPDMFVKTLDIANGLKFQAGMKLEAIDPLNLVSICVATVQKVLRNNYLMIGIDGSLAENGQDWFCYHATSPCIFPVGFCEVNSIELTPPRGYKGDFRWFDYMKQTKSQAAPVKLFEKEIPKHGFRLGMKVEAVDLMEPGLICVGTIMKVVGRLLRIHFDGWESSYDQWVDCNSPDVYPVGWCEMVGYHLEGPKPRDSPASVPQTPPSTKKRRSKGQPYRGPRKKNRWVGKQIAPDLEDMSQSSTTSTNESFMPASWAQVKGQPLAPLEPASRSRDSSCDRSSDLPEADQPFHQDVPARSSAVGYTGSLGSCDTATMPKLADASATELASDEGVVTSAAIARTLVTSSTPATLSISSALALSTTSNIAGIEAVLGLGSSPPIPGTVLTAPISSAKLGGWRPIGTGSPTRIATTTISTPNAPIYPLTVSPGADPKPSSQYVSPYNIPRVMGDPDKDTPVIPQHNELPIIPEVWDVQDVCQFLCINDCGPYCDSFTKKNITGSKFMVLTKEQIVNLTAMKVGPSLKIYDLIQQLKISVASQDQHSPLPGTPVASLSSPSQHSPSSAMSSTVVRSQAIPPLHSPALKAQLTATSNLFIS